LSDLEHRLPGFLLSDFLFTDSERLNFFKGEGSWLALVQLRNRSTLSRARALKQWGLVVLPLRLVFLSALVVFVGSCISFRAAFRS
jgi:hypothetical protein